ncbi:hypothetical protein LTR09_003540 [Extremus antarcticus]|uniref:GPR1/FUN34/YaaH-class plasma membrane protein n=1 Tax=Extremus antarcticus TaxID=702011 RepID=A0AAJ0DS15_9PEZI|nr:hypothetical protein LTR09_003540 [Extremus antarcticus]
MSNGQSYTHARDMENGSNNENKLQHIDSEDQLRNALTKSMTLSPELYEKVFLAPKNQVSGDLRKTFANPTPIAIMGFVVALLPLSIEFSSVGWRGSGGTFGTPSTTCSIFFGGVLLTLGGVGEFILGNTFPFVVFFGYGAHFFTFATTFMPFYGAVSWNSLEAPGNPYSPGPTFAAGFGFYPLSLALLSFLFLICSLRTNAIFVLIFVFATCGFSCAAAGLWYTAAGAAATGTNLIVATGALFFVADLLGWYLLFAIMIATMELPVPDLPVFDLSTVIKAKSRSKQE